MTQDIVVCDSVDRRMLSDRVPILRERLNVDGLLEGFFRKCCDHSRFKI